MSPWIYSIKLVFFFFTLGPNDLLLVVLDLLLVVLDLLLVALDLLLVVLDLPMVVLDLPHFAFSAVSAVFANFLVVLDLPGLSFPGTVDSPISSGS